MSRGHHSRKHHAHGRKHKSMRKHKRSMSRRREGHGHKHKSMRRHGHGRKHKSMRRHKRSMSRRGHGHKSMRRHKTRKMGRGYGPPGDSPDVRPSDMRRNENMDFPDSTALETWRGYNRNNYSQAQWDQHISAILDAIEHEQIDDDSLTQAEYTDLYVD